MKTVVIVGKSGFDIGTVEDAKDLADVKVELRIAGLRLNGDYSIYEVTPEGEAGLYMCRDKMGHPMKTQLTCRFIGKV